MQINPRMAQLLFESAEAIGIRRDELTAPLGLDAATLVRARSRLEWDTLVALLAVLSTRVQGDVAQIEDVGRHMVRAPPLAFLQRVARAVFSLQDLYRAGDHWMMPSHVPHLIVQSRFPTPDRLSFRCTIPEPYAPSEPYLHVFVGLLVGLPTMLGLTPARIVRREIKPRELELELDLPSSRGLFGRLRRGARAFWYRSEIDDVIAQQGREVVEGLAAARQSVQEIQSLFDKLPDLVLIHRAGTILWANRATAATLGYEPDGGLVGVALREIVAPPSRALVQHRLQEPLPAGAEPPVVEAKLRARDGTEVLAEVFPVQPVSFGGRAARLVVAHDVTERTRLRQRLLVTERLASIGMLAAGVAHEVNNPLAYVLNNVEMVRRELAPFGDRTASSRAALGVALEGIERIRVIIRDLLALSRTEAEVIGAVDVRAVVESTLALAAPSVASHALLVSEYEAVPLARGTPARIGQVVLNLVSNALEAMPPRPREQNVLRVAVRPSTAGGAVIEVADNGRGIAPENAPHVFDPFFTTKAMGSGTGLGLTISQRLVTEMGGELRFESTPERGTTFRVTLAP